MKELDVLLTGWLERRYPAAGEDRRAAFERLLETADPQLADWVLGRARPADPELAGLVDELLDRPG